jgi:hypothetical protein
MPRVISDAPADVQGDRLAFDRYVSPMVKILTDAETETPFTIGIFGTWGSGKSTLLRMIADTLAAKHPDKFVLVTFDPWVYRGEANMLVPLLHTLNDALETQKARFVDALGHVGKVLLALGSDLVLKTFTADALSLESITKASEMVSDTRTKIASEMRNLRGTLESTAESVHKKGARLVLSIDNLDRCQPDQIVDLLEAVKLFLDVKHVFILLAVDKEVIDRGIEVRFSKFEFAKDARTIGAEYLEKMVQLPLALYPLTTAQVGKYVTDLTSSKLVKDHLPLLEKLLIANPRKIKRIVNILNVAGEVADQLPKNRKLKPDLLARIVVLQVQGPEVFAQASRLPVLMSALELVYQKKKNLDNANDFLEYGPLGEVVLARCKEFYRPETYLAELFKDSSFTVEKERLVDYFSLVGA